MKATNILKALVLTSLMCLPAMAVAGNCKNVDVKIKNNTSFEIKIKKIWHYDFGKAKWRSNSTTNRKVSDGYSRTYTKNLQYVKGENTQIGVLYYQYGAEVERWAYSSTFHCDKGDLVVVDIDTYGGVPVRPPMEGRPVPSTW